MRQSRLGHNIQSYRDPGMAGAAVDFRVAVRRILSDSAGEPTPGAAARPAAAIAVDVSMANKAGHSIPDG